MRIGVHVSLWQETWDEDITPHIERAASLGFDGIEVSLFTLRALDVRTIRRRIEAAGLAVTCSTGLLAATDITSDDASVRRVGVEQLRRDIAIAADAGSKMLCGVLYAAWGRVAYGAAYAAAWERSIDGLRQAAETAGHAGVTLGLEALNRYESGLLNTSGQARRLADAVGVPHLGVHLDTYHMNIEEPDLAAAVAAAGPRLVHVHCADGDRGAPGTGHIAWNRLAAALQSAAYNAWLVLECAPRTGTPVADSFSVWRDLGTPDAIASRGLAFLRGLVAAP